MLLQALILSFINVIIASEQVRYDNYTLYKLSPQNKEQLKYLKDLQQNGDGLDFWYLPYNVGDFASVIASPDKKEEFEHNIKRRSIHSEIMLQSIQEAIDSQAYSRRKRSLHGSEFGTEYLGAGQLYWDGFQTYEQILAWFDHLVAEYPEVVTIVHGGKSYEGRNITGIKISRGSGRRAFFIEGGQVGADWLSPAVTTYIADQLIRGEDPEARAASEEFDWHFFPITNPDGHQYSQDADRTWIKNRRPVSADAIGVDLTKNWNSQWGVSGGSHYPEVNNYIGLGPFSEIETRTLSAYIESIGTNLDGLLSFRQFGQRFLIPFAHSSDRLYNYNEMLVIARRAMGSLSVKYGTQYIVGTSRDVHDGATGVLADWVKYRFNPPIVGTYQLRDTGTWGYIFPGVWVQSSCEETFDSVMAIIREAKFIKVL